VLTKLDAGQSPTLAHLAAPLAVCVQQYPYNTTKVGCHGNVPCDIEKNNFRLIIYSNSFTNHHNLANIGLVYFEITGLTGIVKNN